jgi:hypothetical protein
MLTIRLFGGYTLWAHKRRKAACYWLSGYWVLLSFGIELILKKFGKCLKTNQLGAVNGMAYN